MTNTQPNNQSQNHLKKPVVSTTLNSKIPASLRKRYISLTIILGLFVISIVTFSYINLVGVKNNVNAGYIGVVKERQNLQSIRNVLLLIHEDINRFVVDPLNEDLLYKIDGQTQNAGQFINALVNSKHEFHRSIDAEADSIKIKFAVLNTEVKRLVEYRLDINKQYPALDLSANEMENQQDQIKSYFEILINEAETEDFGHSPLPFLLKANITWEKAISQTRIYMTNRLASYSAEILSQQGQSLKDIYDLFALQMKDIEEIYSQVDSFEGPETITKIKQIGEKWFTNWLLLREISEHGDWRSDTVLLKVKILPLINQITAEIDQLDAILETEKQNIDAKRESSDNAFNMLIFAIIALFLIFIAALLLSMEWMLFSPIQRVTQALKSKAFEIELPEIQKTKTLEMDRLIEAFKQMHNEVSQRQNDLEHMAMHDFLTGLPNRFMLHQRIEYQLLTSERNKKQFALFVMDLDFFKEINDTLGHASGDNLLIAAAERMQKLIRGGDTLARMGGDEFALLLPDTDKDGAIVLAEKILDSVSQPFEINQEKVSINISIGIVTYPEDGKQSETLLQFADMAMYTAKNKRTGYAFYDAKDNIYSMERLMLANDVQQAIENDEFELYYQPKIDNQNQVVIGAEALLRWNHSSFGFVSPETIVETAERIGVMHKLSIYVLEKAVAECKKWHEAGTQIRVSVNLSVRDLTRKELCPTIEKIMRTHALGYEYLTVEITESVMMENLANSLEQLDKLHQLGITIAIDDFGTGFSSLAYLKRLPVDELKIDKSFIMDITQDENDKEIVRSTIALGHNLKLKVTAEGVEDEATQQILKEYECDYLQGYLISRPLPAEEFQQTFLR